MTTQLILENVRKTVEEHERRLQDLTDEAEKELLQSVIKAEKKISLRLKRLVAQFDVEKIDSQFRIQNSSANIDIASRIYSIIQSDLRPFSDEATQWAMTYLSDSFEQGLGSIIETYNAGADSPIVYTFGEHDAMVMEIALTKGYGKNQRGIGKIKEISQETSDSIRDIILRAIAERRTPTDLYEDLVDSRSGLTSLESIDRKGIRRRISLQQRAKLVARNEIAQIYQLAATEKARDVFGEDSYWYYGSVYEKEKITDWCKKRFGRIAKLTEWNSSEWVNREFGDRRTGTGHIHVNCRQSGYAVSPEWFSAKDWEKLVKGKQHLLTGKDLAQYDADPDKKIPESKIFK